MGWPRSIRSDAGLQFCGKFPTFCVGNNIEHHLSGPYNPKSNGLAEATVKNVKYLLQKCLANGEDVDSALYE